MGSPNMNFLDTTIQHVDAESVTVGLPGGGTVSVPVKGQGVNVGDKATLGVRPEHLLEGGGGDGEVSGKVLVVERLGGGTLIYAKLTDDQTISAQIDGNSAIRVDDTIKLGLRNETCHVFTADGLALPQTIVIRWPISAAAHQPRRIDAPRRVNYGLLTNDREVPVSVSVFEGSRRSVSRNATPKTVAGTRRSAATRHVTSHLGA